MGGSTGATAPSGRTSRGRRRRAHGRRVVAVLATVALATGLGVALAVPSGASVANPGPLTITVTGGAVDIGAFDLDLGDVADITLAGTIEADGALALPAAGVAFPTIDYEGHDLDFAAAGDGAGAIDPAAGTVALAIDLEGTWTFDGLGSCTMVLPLALAGSYDAATGTGTMADGAVAVAAGSCDDPDLEDLFNAAVPLPNVGSVTFGFSVSPAVEAPAEEPATTIGNPGPVTFTITGGALQLGTQTFPLAAGTSFAGSVDADGIVTIPAGNIAFPPSSTEQSGLTIGITTQATGPASGTIDPTAGTSSLTLGLRINLDIGGLTTCDFSFSLALVGSYDATTGRGTMSDSTFAVPGATCANPAITPLVNSGLGIPAPSGQNSAVFEFATDPVLVAPGQAVPPTPALPVGQPQPQPTPQPTPAPGPTGAGPGTTGDPDPATGDPGAPAGTAPLTELPFTGTSEVLAALGAALLLAGLVLRRASGLRAAVAHR